MTHPISAIGLKFATYDFLDMLVKLSLTTHYVPVRSVESFVRRQRSRYDTSPIIHSAYNDSLI